MDNLKFNKAVAKTAISLVSRIYGFDDAILIEFDKETRFPNKEVMALATSDFRIVFNNDKLREATDYEVYITSFHEIRHIYQRCCIEFGKSYKQLKEPKKRIKQWKYEDDHYYVSEIIDDEKYLRQDIEIDAIAFSYYMMDLLFDNKVILPESIKKEALKRTKEIGKKLAHNKYVKLIKANREYII